MNAFSVLLVDDHQSGARFGEMLKFYGYRFSAETDPEEALRCLESHDFDAILLDLAPVGSQRLNLLRVIREQNETIPILVVTSYGGSGMAAEALELGATDFLNEPAEAPILHLRIQKAVELESSRQRANTDGLTGLCNHRFFQERLQQEIRRATRYKRPLSLILADIDHFKSFNDTFGHPRGDEALIEVASILKRVSRSSDIVARYGGEEFAVVLPETATDRARVFGDRICREVSTHPFLGQVQVNGSNLTISAGIATCDPSGSREELIKAADGALYQAKRLGRNRVCVIA